MEKRYAVEVGAMAIVKGTIYVTANSADEAQDKALEKLGDCDWKYNGVDDDTVVVNSVDEQ